MIEPMPYMPMPTFDVPKKMAFSLEGVDVGEKIKATINYEVVRKTEHYVMIAIDMVYFNKSKRVR